MSDSRPVDQPQNDALRTRLEAWLNQQNQTLLEEVMATWQNALGNFHPDETLLAQLREGAAPSPVLAPAGPQAPDLAPGLDLLEGAASQSDLLKRLRKDGVCILMSSPWPNAVPCSSSSRGWPPSTPTGASRAMPPGKPAPSSPPRNSRP